MSSSAAAPMPSSTSTGSAPCAARTTRTPSRTWPLRRETSAPAAASSIRSALFTTTMSAEAIWSAKSSERGVSWSSPSSARRWASTAARFAANCPAATAGPSTTATTPSTVTRVEISGQPKARTSGCGRARPEVSITIWSGGVSRPIRLSMVGTKSSATVQQMQPLDSSTISSSPQVSSPQPLRMSPSTPRSPNSLIMSAMRRPPALSSRWRISVVLPAPRKPVTMVAGILAGMWRSLQWLRRGQPPARMANAQAAANRRRVTRPEPARPRRVLAAASTARSASGSTTTTSM